MTELPSRHHKEVQADEQSIASCLYPDSQVRAEQGVDVQRTHDSVFGEAQSGRNVSMEHSEYSMQLPNRVVLGREAIIPGPIVSGGTEFVLQRHGKYIRDKDNPDVGKLTPDAIYHETETAKEYFSRLILQTPENERDRLNVLFVSSDTNYAGKGQRSYQTTEIAQQVAEQLFQENGIHLLNILNISPYSRNLGNPIAMQTLREPQMFEKSPNFVSFMRGKYGDLTADFWIAFEEDTEREARLEAGAEGPDEIADRMNAALAILARYSKDFHTQYPSSRLVVWVGTHYDTISPLVKRDILHQDKNVPVLVDYGGGLVIAIDERGEATTSVAGRQFEVNL